MIGDTTRQKLPPKRHCACIATCPKTLLAVSLGVLLLMQSMPVAATAQERASSNSQEPGQSSVSGKSDASNPPRKSEVASATKPEDLPSAPEPQAPAQAQSSGNQQNSPQQPVGTAAAPYEEPTGVPGSRPAGAVIAPAKQRRVRAIVIRFGLLLAGGAAIGTVVGLSRASHSQP